MKKTVTFVGTLVLIFLMTAAIFVLLAPRLGWRVDAVFSGSMEPELKTGGVVITRPVVTEEIKVGDIITFNSPQNEQMTSHRVTAVQDGVGFRTKGDANEDIDPYILPAANVVGEVCFHLPYFGYVAQYVKTPLGLLIAIGLPGLIIVIMELRKIWLVCAEDNI